MPEGVSSSFKHEVTGPVPQNLGISNIDTVADQAIARDAEKGWEVAGERYKAKHRILANNPQASGKDLSNLGGGYRVMSKPEVGVFERARAINSKAMDWKKQGSGAEPA